MDGPLYRYADAAAFQRGEAGAVAPWNGGIVFRCLCGERQVYVGAQNGMTLDPDGLVTLARSCASAADPRRGREKGWCHFWLKAGKVKICSDAKCPGAAAGG